MRMGLVGTGGWARGVHGAGAQAHPDWELVSVWGRDPAKAAEAAAGLGCTSAATFEELLDAVDAVAFGVPPDVQAPLALQAARAGKHLLLEKPVDVDDRRAEQLLEAVNTSGVAGVVFLTRLWSPLSVGWLDAMRTTAGWSSGRAAFVAGLPDDFLQGSPWRRSYGALWDVGPHALSVLEEVLGGVTAVRAVGGLRDHVVLTLEHDSGAVSTAELTLLAPPSAVHTSVSFWGQSGISEPLPVTPPEDSGADFRAGVAAALSALHTAARSGVPVERGGLAQGVRLTGVLAAAQRDLS